jgi:3-phenylpropionate/trans-cinnamate dioxygenase ferredoxin reductase component
MSAKPVFLIVGASLTGAKAAEELGAQGFDGRVVLIGAEPERPYERPPLTKDYLRGEAEREKAYVHPGGFYAQQEIELVTGVTVTSIDPGESRVTLDDGRTVGYDRLLLATGAEPRRIPVRGASLDGVYYLRTMADCDRLRARLNAGGRVVVAGAGWIGSEFAASARQRGLDVTVLDPQPLPNERIFGREIGTFYRDVHAQHGIDLLLGEGIDSFEGNGAVAHVWTTGGRRIECDFAVVGIGVVPRTGLAAEAGLKVDFSDQYDVGMEYSGYAPDWDEVVFRGDPADGEFIAFWLRDGRVVAGMNVNVWDVNEHIQALIRARQPVGVAALADPGSPLDRLAGELAPGS